MNTLEQLPVRLAPFSAAPSTGKRPEPLPLATATPIRFKGARLTKPALQT